MRSNKVNFSSQYVLAIFSQEHTWLWNSHLIDNSIFRIYKGVKNTNCRQAMLEWLVTQVEVVRWWKKQYWSKKKRVSYLVWWFLAKTAVNDHWACTEKYCVQGKREKLGGSLEMVEDGVECLFQTTSHFMKILKLMVFYRDSQIHCILRRFWNLWYFTEVLKPMIFNLDFERFFLKFKKSKKTCSLKTV